MGGGCPDHPGNRAGGFLNIDYYKENRQNRNISFTVASSFSYFCSWSNEISTFSPWPPFGRVFFQSFVESGNHWKTPVITRFLEGLGVPKGYLFYMFFIG